VTFSRSLAFIFSICLHGAIAGSIFFLSADRPAETELVYHVSLAEFIQPGIMEEASASVAPQPVLAKPAVMPPRPAASEPQPEFAAGSTGEHARQARPASPLAPPAAPASTRPQEEAQTASEPRPRHLGGLSVYDQEHVDQRPSISRRVAPEYPARARRMKIEGTVMVELVVDSAGLPQACAIRSADPAGYFEQAALSAARKMRFRPGKIRGVSVNTMVMLPFVFRLR
jgi:protein TonB